MDAETLDMKLDAHEKLDEQKWDNMQQDLTEIKSEIKNLPDKVISQINNYTNLKIAYEIQQLKSNFYKWVSGLSIGLLIELAIIFFQIFSTPRT